MSGEAEAREALVLRARSMFDRGLTSGSSGNISLRFADGWLITPTNSCMGELTPDALVQVDSDWSALGDGLPSKEWPLHAAMYDSRPGASAVVHLHSAYAVAVSCLEDLDPDDVLPALTPYYVMRVAPLALASYRPPGDPALADDIRARAVRSHSILLQNHGPIVAGETLTSASFAAEELEASAKLFLLLHGKPTRTLSALQVSQLQDLFLS